MPEPHDRYTLGDWTFLPAEQALIAPDGQHVVLERRTAAVLHGLARADGRLVRRDNLLRSAWQDVIVSDDSLYRCISQLRKVFAAGHGRTPSVVTVRGTGYRLVIEERAGETVAAAEVHDDRKPALGSRRTEWIAAAGAFVAIVLLAVFTPAPPGPSADDLTGVGDLGIEHRTLLSLAFVDSLDAEALAELEIAVERDTAEVEALLGSVSALRPELRWTTEPSATD